MAAAWFRQPSILPGFGLTLGFTTFFLSALVLLPLAALVFKTTSLTWAEFVAHVLDERAVASYRLSFGAALHRRDRQRGLRLHRRLVARALRVSRAPPRRRADRPAVRAAHRRLGHRARHGVLADRLARRASCRRRRHPGGLHVARRRRRADADRPAVRRALGAARAGRGAARPRGSGRDARCGPVHDLPPHHPAGRASGAADRLHDGVRARHRRIRLGRVHLRQPADEDRDHAAADRDQARAVRLQRRRGPRLHHAAGVVRHAVRDQPRAGLERAAAGRQLTRRGAPCTCARRARMAGARPRSAATCPLACAPVARR